MNFPPPTDKQARLFWRAVTGMAWGILVALVVLLAWVIGWVLRQLSAVLIPLAIAGILSYVLEPLVALLERRGLSRNRSILWVFAAATVLVVAMTLSVGPRLIAETNELIDRLPDYAEQLNVKFQ